MNSLLFYKLVYLSFYLCSSGWCLRLSIFFFCETLSWLSTGIMISFQKKTHFWNLKINVKQKPMYEYSVLYVVRCYHLMLVLITCWSNLLNMFWGKRFIFNQHGFYANFYINSIYFWKCTLLWWSFFKLYSAKKAVYTK